MNGGNTNNDAPQSEDELPWLIFDQNRLCTRAYFRFAQDYIETVRFFFLTISLATRADEVRMHASKTLAEVGGSDEDKERYRVAQEKPTLVFDELKKFGDMQSQNLVVRTCNAFLLYYSEIIQAAVRKRPEILKSRQTIRWDELLSFSRFDDVVAYLIDQKINELAYGGLKGMEEFLAERLGLSSMISDDQRSLASVLVEARNIYTHNRGIVNGVFLNRVHNVEGIVFAEGKYFHVNFDLFRRLSNNALEVAFSIDQACSKKFALKRKRYLKWADNGNAVP